MIINDVFKSPFNTFQIRLLCRSLLIYVLITVVKCLLINEINFSHNDPFVEIAKEPEAEKDMAIPFGHYGLIVFHYSVLEWDKRNKDRPRLRVRVAFDLSGYDFTQNFFVLGNVPNLQPNIGQIKIPHKLDGNWLKPPDKSYVIIVLTFHNTVSLLDQQNWENVEFGGKKGRFTAVTGNLRKYIQENSYDMVSISSKNEASKGDKAKMFEELLALFPYKENSMWHLKSTEDEAEPKSQNRCNFYSEKFSPKSFQFGNPSPNRENHCDDQSKIEGDIDKDQSTCNSESNPVYTSSAVEDSLKEKQAERSDLLEESMKKIEKWGGQVNTDWDYVAYLVRTNQNNLINWRLFLNPEVQTFLQYLIDPKDPKRSKFK